MNKRNRILTSLMLAIAVAIFVFSLAKIDLQQAKIDLQESHWWWFIVAFIFMCLFYFIQTFILRELLDDKPKLTTRDLLRIPLLEAFGNGITPMSVGGQPMQLLGLTQAGVSGPRSGSVLIMKFIVFQAMIMVAFAIAILTGYGYVAEHLASMKFLVIFGIVIHFVVIFGLIMTMYWHKMTTRLVHIILYPLKFAIGEKGLKSLYKKVDKALKEFHDESINLSKNKDKLLRVAALTLIQLFFLYIIPYWILLGFGIYNVNPLFIIALHVIITMVISIFPVPGGSGGAELTFSALFSQFLVTGEKVILAMLIWRVITYYFGMFAGILAYNLDADYQLKKSIKK